MSSRRACSRYPSSFFEGGDRFFLIRFLRPSLLAVLIMHKVLPIFFIKISLSFCENSFYKVR